MTIHLAEAFGEPSSRGHCALASRIHRTHDRGRRRPRNLAPRELPALCLRSNSSSPSSKRGRHQHSDFPTRGTCNFLRKSSRVELPCNCLSEIRSSLGKARPRASNARKSTTLDIAEAIPMLRARRLLSPTPRPEAVDDYGGHGWGHVLSQEHHQERCQPRASQRKLHELRSALYSPCSSPSIILRRPPCRCG